MADLWLKADCDKQNFHDGKVFCIELDVTRAKDTYCVIMIFVVVARRSNKIQLQEIFLLVGLANLTSSHANS